MQEWQWQGLWLSVDQRVQGVPGARDTQGRAGSCCLQPAAFVRQAYAVQALPGATVGD